MHAIVIYFLIHRRDILIIVKVGDLSVCSQKTTLAAISSHVFCFVFKHCKSWVRIDATVRRKRDQRALV
jgi:hypothetical protein